jgi:hypothetical protein
MFKLDDLKKDPLQLGAALAEMASSANEQKRNHVYDVAKRNPEATTEAIRLIKERFPFNKHQPFGPPNATTEERLVAAANWVNFAQAMYAITRLI